MAKRQQIPAQLIHDIQELIDRQANAQPLRLNASAEILPTINQDRRAQLEDKHLWRQLMVALWARGETP